jgi:pyruvate/2-oxoglutarate/acetoin dehydrogenase E1 component
MFMHVPGLKVVAPATPHDAKGCLVAAIRDNNPVIFMEHRMLYGQKGLVPTELYEVPFGKARILAEGDDITIVAISYMVVEALRAKAHLAEIGIHAEVIDPVSLAPLDVDTVVTSVEKTGRLLVVDTDWTACGASAELITEVVERMQGHALPRFARMGYAPSACPTTKPLENLYYPNGRTIAARAKQMITGRDDWEPHGEEPREIAEFKGPF